MQYSIYCISMQRFYIDTIMKILKMYGHKEIHLKLILFSPKDYKTHNFRTLKNSSFKMLLSKYIEMFSEYYCIT